MIAPPLEIERSRRLLHARLGREPQEMLEAAVVLEAWAGVPAQQALATARALMGGVPAEPSASVSKQQASRPRSGVVLEGAAFVLTVVAIALWATPLSADLGTRVVEHALKLALPVTLALQWGLRSRYLGRPKGLLELSKKVAGKVVKRRAVAATATIRQGSRKQRVSFSLTAGQPAAKAKGFWTNGHLQCSQDGSGAPPAYLTQPDFTTRTPTPVSTRGWIAWYTAAGGWHWLGSGGENVGRWDTWTATVSGIAPFHPDGAATPIPFTWDPVSVPAGQAIHAVGVYDIVYWVGGRPDYQWQYVNAGVTGAAAAGSGTLYCAYA